MGGARGEGGSEAISHTPQMRHEYVCVCACERVFVCFCVSVCVCMHVCMSVFVYAYCCLQVNRTTQMSLRHGIAGVRVCVCLCVCVCVCVCVYMCV